MSNAKGRLFPFFTNDFYSSFGIFVSIWAHF